MHSDDDPGWGGTWRYALVVFIPGWTLMLQRKAETVHGLIILRGVLLSFVVLLVLVGGPIVLLGGSYPGSGELSEAAAAAAVSLVGLASLVLPSFLARPLNDESDARLARSYGKMLLRGVGLAQIIVFAGILAFVFTGARWMYLLAAAFTAIRFWQVAPTARNLQHEQARLEASNSPRSLIAALRTGNPFGGG